MSFFNVLNKEEKHFADQGAYKRLTLSSEDVVGALLPPYVLSPKEIRKGFQDNSAIYSTKIVLLLVSLVFSAKRSSRGYLAYIFWLQ